VEYFGGLGVVSRERPKGRGVFPDMMPYRIKFYGNNDCLLQYEDSHAAHAAPSFFDGTEFLGSKIKVELAEKKPNQGLSPQENHQPPPDRKCRENDSTSRDYQREDKSRRGASRAGGERKMDDYYDYRDERRGYDHHSRGYNDRPYDRRDTDNRRGRDQSRRTSDDDPRLYSRQSAHRREDYSRSRDPPSSR